MIENRDWPSYKAAVEFSENPDFNTVLLCRPHLNFKNGSILAIYRNLATLYLPARFGPNVFVYVYIMPKKINVKKISTPL